MNEFKRVTVVLKTYPLGENQKIIMHDVYMIEVVSDELILHRERGKTEVFPYPDILEINVEC